MPSGWTISAAHNNARLLATRDTIDAGPSAGKLRLYNGTRPASGGTPTTLLCEIILDEPCGSIVSNTLVITSADTPLCVATGTATWGRIVDGSGNFVADGDVSTVAAGTGQIQLDDVNLIAGGRIGLAAAVLT